MTMLHIWRKHVFVSQPQVFLLIVLLGLFLTNTAQARMSLYGGGTYTPEDTINLEVYLGDNERTELNLYHIENPEKVLELGGPQGFQGSNELELDLLKTYPLKKRKRSYYESIKVQGLPLGMYFAQVGEGEQAAATLILITDLGMVVKSDQDTALTYTANLESGNPKKSSVYLLSSEGIIDESISDTDGLARFERSEDSPILAANAGKSWAFSSSYWQSWNVRKSKVYVHTDRSVYRPTSHSLF